MPRRPVAPALTAFLGDQFAGTPFAGPHDWAGMKRELAGFKALAISAKKVAHSEWCEVWSGEPCNCPSKDVARALRRLERARGGGK